MKRLILVVALLSFGGSMACATAPVTASQPAQVAFRNTRVINSLNTLADIARDANAQGVLSDQTTGKIVQFHKSALLTIDASSNSWKLAVLQALTEVQNNLTPDEKYLLGPYFTLASTIIKEVIQ